MICTASASVCRQDFTLTVTAALLAIIVSAFSQSISKSKILYFLQLFYVLLCIFIPDFCFLLPVIVYEMIQYENKYLGLIFLLPLVNYFFINRFILSVIIFSCTVLSVILSVRTFKLEKIQAKLIIQRDSLEENKIILTQRNEYLINNMDNEIDLAILTERTRIAREIHDNVGHMLSRTLLQLGAVKIINSDEKIKPHLDDINNSINSAMTSIRESVHNLHNDAVSLENTINEIIKPLNESYSVRLDIDISENTPKEIKFCLIGIVKEAISNIIRHSNADTVSVIIREHPAFYQTVIENNGSNSGKINEGGIGMENMRKRVEKLNGIFKYYLKKNSFKIFVSVPKKEK